jgi:hypothetical protein
MVNKSISTRMIKDLKIEAMHKIEDEFKEAK